MIFQIIKNLFRFKNRLILPILVFLLIGSSVLAQSSTINAGIVNGLWYSKVPFFAGDQIRIYTALQNQSGFDITGVIQFLDGGIIVGESDFSVVNGDFIKEWIDWEVTQGYHSISIKIIDAQKHEIDKDPESIFLNLGVLESDEQFADFDTDGDLIGNEEDLDDDNDGVNDDEEIIIGTNPLIADTDNDGISDGEEIEAGTDPLVFDEVDIEESLEIAEQAEKVLNFTKEEAEKILQRIIDGVEDKQIVVQKEIEEETNSRPIFEKALAAIGSNFDFLKIPEEKIPTWNHIYSWFLSLVLFILERPWMLLIILLLIIKVFWRFKK